MCRNFLLWEGTPCRPHEVREGDLLKRAAAMDSLPLRCASAGNDTGRLPAQSVSASLPPRPRDRLTLLLQAHAADIGFRPDQERRGCHEAEIVAGGKRVL